MTSVGTIGVIALIKVVQLRRRGQTVRQAFAASPAERQRRVAARERARQAAAVWMERARPSGESGVLVLPAAATAVSEAAGFDVVLESAGDKKIQVIRQISQGTRLSVKEAKDIVDRAPITVLRVPDQLLACAAQDLLQSVGASVSIAFHGPGILAIPRS